MHRRQSACIRAARAVDTARLILGHTRGTPCRIRGRGSLQMDGGAAQGTSTSRRLAGQWCQSGIATPIGGNDGLNSRGKKDAGSQAETEPHTHMFSNL